MISYKLITDPYSICQLISHIKNFHFLPSYLNFDLSTHHRLVTTSHLLQLPFAAPPKLLLGIKTSHIMPAKFCCLPFVWLTTVGVIIIFFKVNDKSDGHLSFLYLWCMCEFKESEFLFFSFNPFYANSHTYICIHIFFTILFKLNFN